METEIWKDIKGYEGLYKVSNLGNILSKKTNRISNGFKHTRGYRKVYLYKNIKRKSFFIHRLVLLSFLGDGGTMDVNHINGIKDDNRVENLEYCTKSENIIHYYKFLKNKSLSTTLS